ncbi:hypothetical protein FRC07_009526 [Ceratobasidium sp. 392]|nr:hypothetical protein FRC07_009526 [Ceratobasidium sp. 392]
MRASSSVSNQELDLFTLTHKGEEFLKWMKANHPLIILLFVPAGCTSIAQPCDTQINRIMKHLIKSVCVEYLSQQTQRQLQAGVPASQVKLDTTLCTLRDASAAWLMEAWIWFQEHPQTVRDAWRDTTFGEWDLSYETLTSAQCWAIVYECFNEETAFSLAISSQIPTDPDFVEADSPEFDDDSALDPDLLVDIRGRLPMDVELEQEGSYVYTGDTL